MYKVSSLCKLPDNLPIPLDDGACDHLLGIDTLGRNIHIYNTNGEKILWDSLARNNNIIIFIYPMMGKDSSTLPDGWDSIPGARGCTPQACTYRDNLDLITSLGYHIFGLSTQEYSVQRELSTNHYLRYQLLNDHEMGFKKMFNVPTFIHHGNEYYKRVTLVIKDGKIEDVFYPVFPPGSEVEKIIQRAGTSVI